MKLFHDLAERWLGEPGDPLDAVAAGQNEKSRGTEASDHGRETDDQVESGHARTVTADSGGCQPPNFAPDRGSHELFPGAAGPGDGVAGVAAGGFWSFSQISRANW